MKKRFWILLLCLTAAMVLLLSSVSADGGSDATRVFDEDGILDDSEKEKLENRIKEIRQEYEFDVVIRVVNMEDLKYEMLEAFTDDYYDTGINSKYHFGEDGLLIFLNMCDDEDGRDYWFNGCEKGAVWFDNYFFDFMKEETNFISYLKSGDYYKAFDETLDYVKIFLEEATTGEEPYSYSHPYKKPKEPMSGTKFTILSIIEAGVALLFGKGYAKKLRNSMNTAIKRTEATEYINQSSFNVTRASDMFLYSNVTRTPIPTETRSSGGSSIHTSSGGHSHSGGGGHF